MHGYIDKTGKELIKFDYDQTVSPFNEGYAVLSSGGIRSYYIMKNPLPLSKRK